MTIIVSGANGYIGKAFLRRLLQTGHREIRALVRSEKAKNELTTEFDGLDVVVVHVPGLSADGCRFSSSRK